MCMGGVYQGLGGGLTPPHDEFLGANDAPKHENVPIFEYPGFASNHSVGRF